MVTLRTPFYSPADAGGGASGDPDAGGGGDDGFTYESASVAFTEAPSDTTAGRDPGDETVQSEASASAAQPVEAAEGEESGTKGEETAPPAVQAKTSQKPAPKKKATAGERVADLQKQIDTLTHAKHKTAAEIERDTTRAAALRKEIADLEAKKASTTGAASAPAADAGGGGAASVSAATAAAAPEPKAPRYRDFATDEEYETAFTKWQTDHSAWSRAQLDSRVDAAKKDITEGVESRFTSVEADAAKRAALGTMATTLEEVRAADPEWNTAREAIKDLTSAWYDPAKHGPSPTPFLSDLSQSLLMRGNKEGALLLTWLGQDPARAQRIADLRPNRPLRDALVRASSVRPLLEYFATDDGAQQFEVLKQMHPIDMMQSIGALQARLQPAPRGSGAAAHPITGAQPSARPPGGTPGASTARPAQAGGKPNDSFVDWMAAEDERERVEKMRAAGISA